MTNVEKAAKLVESLKAALSIAQADYTKLRRKQAHKKRLATIQGPPKPKR